jgi:hypothetical protein
LTELEAACKAASKAAAAKSHPAVRRRTIAR